MLEEARLILLKETICTQRPHEVIACVTSQRYNDTLRNRTQTSALTSLVGYAEEDYTICCRSETEILIIILGGNECLFDNQTSKAVSYK